MKRLLIVALCMVNTMFSVEPKKLEDTLRHQWGYLLDDHEQAGQIDWDAFNATVTSKGTMARFYSHTSCQFAIATGTIFIMRTALRLTGYIDDPLDIHDAGFLGSMIGGVWAGFTLKDQADQYENLMKQTACKSS